MKKALLTTTALVATVGAAHADGLSISGYFEAGIAGGDGSPYAAGETQFLQHLSVKFSGTGTTDSGLSFGVTAEIDDTSDQNAAGSPGTVRLDSETFFISGSFGKLSLGDQDGAFDWALREVGFGTSIADDHTSHAGYSGNGGHDASFDNQVLRYTNSFGDFGVALSLELDDTGANDSIIGIGIQYGVALGGIDLGIGIGYQDGETGGSAATTETGIAAPGPDGLSGTSDDITGTTTIAAVPGVSTDIWGISLDFDFAGGFSARLNYSDLDVGGAGTEYTAIGVAYETGNLLLTANYGEFDRDAAADSDGWGIAANYGLGGDASLLFGYADDSNDNDRWSLGLGMSF